MTGTAHQSDAYVGQKRPRMRVMILGGYGVFGGRLIELPSDIDELVLVVCGRNLEPAREFCALYGGAARVEPLALDGSNLSKAPRANKRRLGPRRLKTIKLRVARSIARICTCVICPSSVSATMALGRHHRPMPPEGASTPSVKTVVLDPLNRRVTNSVGL